jgi:hypothetical protein
MKNFIDMMNNFNDIIADLNYSRDYISFVFESDGSSDSLSLNINNTEIFCLSDDPDLRWDDDGDYERSEEQQVLFELKSTRDKLNKVIELLEKNDIKLLDCLEDFS